MRLNLKKLMTGELKKLSFSGELNLAELDFSGEKLFRKPVSFSGSAEDRAGVIFLETDISMDLELTCARCAREISLNRKLHVSHILSEDASGEDPDEEILKISDGEIDLDEPLTTAVILGTDMRYLCSEDCRGLCPKCGKNLNEGDCECPKDIDPRWEALAQLLK